MKQPSKTDDLPVARKPTLEKQICAAIKSRSVLQLKYDDAKPARWFAPHALYRTSKDKICVTGSEMPTASGSPTKEQTHNFEVGRIQLLTDTGHQFRPYTGFSSRGPSFEHGVECAVDRP